MAKSKKCASRVLKKTARSVAMRRLNQLRWASTNQKRDEIPSPENLPELDKEVDATYKSIGQLLQGRRIVNLGHILQEYENIIKHPLRCTLGKMVLINETKIGLNSRLHFYCDNCEKKIIICTDPQQKNKKLNLTQSVVWANLSIGIGKSQCEELFSLMDVPFMAQKTYSRKTVEIKKSWETYMSNQMKEAGEEEKCIAISKGNVLSDGTPFITVIVDGGWSKRSYGHGYNAASGVGIIIGSETKKPLFVGVRNKTCSSCSYYKDKNLEPKLHACALNYRGPSTGMEQDVIVEGFCKSVEQHGLVYKYVIGDGDSSVYANIIERVPYGRQVIKIECANHMTRCLSDKLHKLATNTSFPLLSRKCLTNKINSVSRLERLVKAVRTIIKNNINNEGMLRRDLANSPYHVFGNHTNCRDTFCTRKDANEEDMTKKIDQNFFLQIKKIVEPLINKADRLLYNQTTNQAERYMALVAKCTGGKRINFSKSISYTARAYAAAISHGDGPAWHLKAWKGTLGKTTEKIMKIKHQKHMNRKNKATKKKRIRIKPVDLTFTTALMQLNLIYQKLT